MARTVMTILGLALFAASVVVFSLMLGDLLETGTCASGNQPYVIARECPEGTGTKVLLLGAAVLGLVVSFLLIALRGGSGRGRAGAGLLTFMWGAFFTGVGAYTLILALTSETIGPDGELGGIIVGAVFLFMGLPALVWFLYALATPVRDRGGTPTGAGPASVGDLHGLAREMQDAGASFQAGAAPASWSGGGAGPDRIGELERLQRLRDSGALTDAEFEREKARLLGS